MGSQVDACMGFPSILLFLIDNDVVFLAIAKSSVGHDGRFLLVSWIDTQVVSW